MKQGDIAKINAEIFIDLDTANKEYHEKTRERISKVFDSPFDENQKADMARMGINNAMFVNVADYIITALVGLSYSNGNSVSVVGAPKKALLWQAILSKLMKTSNFRLHWHESLVDKYLGGIGFMGIEADPDPTNFLGAKAVCWPAINCRWPMTYKDPLMEDVDHFCYFDVVTLKSAIIRLGVKYDETMLDGIFQAAKVTPLSTLPIFSGNIFKQSGRIENTPVPVIHVYRKDYQNYVKLVQYNKDGTDIISTRNIPIKEGAKVEDGVMSYFMGFTGDEKKALDYIGRFKKDAWKADKLKRVVVQTSVGGYDTGEVTVLPTTLYPWVPLVYKKVRYSNPVGVMAQVEGINIAVNHALQIQIASGRASCGLKVFVGEGNDPEELSKLLSKINAVIPIKVIDSGGGKMFTVDVHQLQASGAQFESLMDRLMSFAEISTGTDDLLRNGVQKGDTPNGGIQRIGSIKFRPHMDNDQAVLSKIGRVLVDCVKAWSQYDKVVRYFESDDVLLEKITGEPDVMANKMEAPGYNLEVPINYRVIEGDEVHYVNDIRNTDPDVEVVFVAAPATEDVKRAWADGFLNTMRELPESSYYLIDQYLSLLNHPDAKKIGKQLRDDRALTGQLEQLKKENERLEREVTLVGQQTIRANRTAEIAKFKSDLSVIAGEFRTFLKQAREGTATPEDAERGSQMLEILLQKLDSELGEENLTTEDKVSKAIN